MSGTRRSPSTAGWFLTRLPTSAWYAVAATRRRRVPRVRLLNANQPPAMADDDVTQHRPNRAGRLSARTWPGPQGPADRARRGIVGGTGDAAAFQGGRRPPVDYDAAAAAVQRRRAGRRRVPGDGGD